MKFNLGRAGIIGGAVAGVLVFIAVAVSAGMFDGLFRKTPAGSATAAGEVETADVVKIPLKSLESGKALFLMNEANGRQIHYFALKSSDGQYRAALDACDVCFQANRGYRQEGELMVCNQCNQTFPANRIGEVKGGCNPHPLAGGTEGEHLVIRKVDILAGKEYFARKRS